MALSSSEFRPNNVLHKAVVATNQTKSRASKLRKTMSPPERILWAKLRSGQLDGLRFRRQHPLGPFIADFYCHAATLVVEIDGFCHDDRLDADADRDRWM